VTSIAGPIVLSSTCQWQGPHSAENTQRPSSERTVAPRGHVMPSGMSARTRSSTDRGAALIDVIVACAIIGILAAISIPNLQASRDRDAARMASRHLAATLQMLRVESIRRNRFVAMRLDPADLGRYATYVDGDGDGVLQADIAAGVDVRLHGDAHLQHFFATVSLRVPFAVPAPESGALVPADSDPVRIGNTDLVSFSPLGSSTSGTIYLAGRDGTLMCVRLLGATGRIRVLRFDQAAGEWRHD
jgi:type II secretory pathway pseudopilin PulG